MDEDKQLTAQQIAAIRKAYELARQLQAEHPEIAKLYRTGRHQRSIVSEIRITEKYGVTADVARVAIGAALRGHNPFFELEGLEGLLSPEECEQLEVTHQVEGGQETYQQGRGIHTETPQFRAERARESYFSGIGLGGIDADHRKLYAKKAGSTAVKKKRGVHGLSHEDHVAHGKKGGPLATLAKGLKLWNPDERSTAYELSQSPSCKYAKGGNKGLTNYVKITAFINDWFHEGQLVRSVNAVKVMLREYTP